MHGGDFDDDRLFVLRRFLQRIDELAQVLDGVDVVMGRGRNGVAPLRNHAGAGDVADDFCAGQVAADAGFRALADFDFDGGAGLQVAFVHAEAPGRHLNDGVRPILIKILVQAALARVVIGAERPRGAREAFVRVVTDGAVAHGRKQDRHFQLQLRRQVVGTDMPLGIALDMVRLFAEEGLGLHRLAQRVDGRIRDLRGVQQHFVPVNRVGLRVPHGGQKHPPGLRLAVNLPDGLVAPLRVDAVGVVVLDDFQRVRGAQRNAAVAVHAF